MAVVRSGVTQEEILLEADFDWCVEKIDVQILDTQTGEIVPGYLNGEKTKFDYWWWAEGNGSCDCNRELCFPDGRCTPSAMCLGSERYLIVETTKGSLRHLNQYYPGELIDKFICSAHIATEMRCTAPHVILPDDDGAACILCANCGQFIRPHQMNEKCPGPDMRTAEERIRDMKAKLGEFLQSGAER